MSGDLHGLVRSSENACEHDRIDVRHQSTQLLELLVHRHAIGDGGDESVGVLLALVLECVAGARDGFVALGRPHYGTADDVVFVLLLHNTEALVEKSIAHAGTRDRRDSLTWTPGRSMGNVSTLLSRSVGSSE